MFVGYARDGRAQPPELTADGFLPTGDLVRIDPEGTITVLGRQKQIIIRGGRNIDVNEVEAAVARIPVRRAGLRGPACPTSCSASAWPHSWCPPARRSGWPTSPSHLAAEGFPKAKWPEFVFDVPDLPQNRVGKLSRPDAVRLAAELHGMT